MDCICSGMYARNKSVIVCFIITRVYIIKFGIFKELYMRLSSVIDTHVISKLVCSEC